MKRRLRIFVLVVLNLLTLAAVCGWLRGHSTPEFVRFSRVLQNDAEAWRSRRVVVGHVKGCIFVNFNSYEERQPTQPPPGDRFGPVLYKRMPANRIPYANRWGFGYFDDNRIGLQPRPRITELASSYVFPYWLVLLIVAPVPAIAAYRRLRRGKRYAAGCCPKCGYDLRASPDRCPECGAKPEAATTATQTIVTPEDDPQPLTFEHTPIEDGEFDIVASKNGQQVAVVECQLGEGGRLLLGNLAVKPSYRKRKYGSGLLDYVIAYARQSGVKTIWGNVVQKDIDVTPHLLDWYRSRGFQLGVPDEPNWLRAVHKVVLEL